MLAPGSLRTAAGSPRTAPGPRPAAPRRFDALAPLALGAVAAVALSACAVPQAPATPAAGSKPTGSTGLPLTSATSPARPTLPPRQPARPAGEKVPATAQAVTISMDLGLNQGGKTPPKPVTITDPAKVRALKSLISDLPPFPPGTFSCPADFGDDLVLTFRAGPRSPALAVATVDLGGCDGVHLTIGGKSQPALAGPGTDSAPQILRSAGLPWKIPTA